MSGAYSNLKELLALRFQARKLNLFRENQPRSLLAGAGFSPFKGRGVDFEEVRAYQHGDDIRSIDWRVTARRMKPHTKLFREERERPVLIILDQSPSLFFGSRLNFKSVTAAEAAALLAWATLNHNDRVGGIIFSQNELSDIRPKRSKKALMHLLNIVSQQNQRLSIALHTTSGENYFCKALRHARRVAIPGTSLFIISDLSMMNEEAYRHMSMLSRNCGIMVVNISDPLEGELPAPGSYDITNGLHRKTINTRSSQLRQHYKNQFQHAQDDLNNCCFRLKIPVIELYSDRPTADQLISCFNEGRPLLAGRKR